MAEAPAGGLLDLEKELTCSICTDILYQPLTLLDCLHTFCGSCLKDWFSFQASHATTPHPYTCPSCRASVRDTKRNAQVTTLLDIFLHANPGRAKSDAEKEELAKKYTHGQNVLRELDLAPDSEDEELMEEVRQRSLQDVGVAQSRLQVPRDQRRDRSRRRSRDRSHESRQGAAPRRRDGSANNDGTASRTSAAGNPSSHTRDRSASHRNIEHQSSLRSLIGSSDVGSDEEEEMMRQILQEIDLNGLDPTREDEINRAVSVAYRRHRHQETRTRPVERAHSPSPSPSPARDGRSIQQRRQHARTDSGPPAMPSPRSSRLPDSRPPISRPHLFQTAETEVSGHHRRSSSQDAHHTRRTRASSDQDRVLLAESVSRPAARSATDLSERPQSSSHPRRMSFSDRSSTDPERTRLREAPPASAASITSQASQSTPPIRANIDDRDSPRQSPARRARQNSQPPSTAPAAMGPGLTSQSPPAPSSPRFPPSATSQARANAISNHPPRSRRTLFVEPSITCYRCNKPHIEYDLHYNCPKCENGSINICLSCYRSSESRGCLHWYGFGHVAKAKYHAQLSEVGSLLSPQPPHVLIGHRYRRPRQTIAQPASASTGPRTMTDEDPAMRLQAGFFCDICSAFANACYWKCDICNDGTWGFCHACVNQGRHCTHLLLPIAKDVQATSPSETTCVPRKDTELPLDTNASTLSPDSSHLSDPSVLRDPDLPPDSHTLTFTTTCDRCRYPIPPSHSRFHCTTCNKGDYDVCFSCYQNLVSSGRIAPQDGDKGWRRCLRGHRMHVVGFEDRKIGRWRRVVRERVGGWSLKDEDIPAFGATQASIAATDPAEDAAGTSVSWRRGRPSWSWRDADGTLHHSNGPRSPPLTTAEPTSTQQHMQRIPPDGGAGMRLRARWAWFPSEGITNELMFPRCAEIREAMDINGDWCWGVYAGRGGLFPGGYVVRAQGPPVQQR